MACDICDTTGVSVTSLGEQYATQRIRFVCVPCEKAVDQKNAALLAAALKKKANEIKAFALQRRAEVQLVRKLAQEREAADARRR